jgi:Mu DNA binding, I gamma subdomain/Bacteriophage Mu transposase
VSAESLRIVADQAQPANPRAAEWLSVDAAAKRMGCSERHVRRLADAGGWEASGLAESRASEDGRIVLHVREDAHRLLCPAKSADELPLDLRTLTRLQRADLEIKIDLLDRWTEALHSASYRNRTEREITDEFILRNRIDGANVTRRTLYRWRDRLKRGGRKALIDGRSRREAEKPAADEFLAEVQRLWLDPRKRSKRFCCDHAALLAEEKGWDVPSIRTVGRFLDRIPVQTTILFREGVEAYKRKAAPHIVRDYSELESNAIWISDHHRLDIIVKDGDGHSRPWLTGWEDARSRMIVGWSIYLGDPNSDVILSTFRNACEQFGIPQKVYLDNGADFDCRELQGITKAERRRLRGKPIVGAGVFGKLGVDVQHARVRQATWHRRWEPAPSMSRQMVG